MLNTLTTNISLQGDLPGSLAGGVFRDVADALLAKQQRGQVLVTGPQSQVGRTTIAVNLSLALLTQKQTVLLLELTNSKPALELTFGASPLSRGVEAVLEGRAKPDSIICQRGDNGLYLGMMKQQCTLNLHARRREQCLTDLLLYANTRFAWTIIDGPSGVDSESVQTLAERASQVVVVAGRRATKRSCLRSMLSMLGPFSPFVLLNN